MENTKELHPAFMHREYLFRRKVLKLFGGAFHVYDENGKLVFYSKQKAFKLREDFQVFSDESKKEELLTIKTPQIFDAWAAYHIKDSTTNEAVGTLKRKFLGSILKDRWIILSSDETEIGELTERSMLRAVLSRLFKLVPQTYVVLADGREIAQIKRHFNPFVLKFTMTILDTDPLIDRRLLVSVGILLSAIEGRQG